MPPLQATCFGQQTEDEDMELHMHHVAERTMIKTTTNNRFLLGSLVVLAVSAPSMGDDTMLLANENDHRGNALN